MVKAKKADYRISNVRYKVNFSIFDLNYKDIEKKNRKIKNIKLKLLKKIMSLNAVCKLLSVCLNLGVNQNIIKSQLKGFLEFNEE